MSNAAQDEDSIMVTVTTASGEMIAKWQDQSGQIWEGRTKERLEAEANA